MKTLKLSMIAAVLTFGLLSLAVSSSVEAHKPMKNYKSIYISLEQAMQNPGLVAEMYMQLDDDFLNNDHKSYMVVVNYQNYNFHITGTYQQWVWFFRLGLKTSTSWSSSKASVI